MLVIQVKGKKGGIGKSTIARELAERLAALGCPSLLIDTSEQANDDILENQQRHFDVTLKECIIDNVPLRDASRQVKRNLWLIAGSRDHEDINTHIRKQRYPDLIPDLVDDLRASLKPGIPFDERFPWWSDEKVSLALFHPNATNDEEFDTPPSSLDYCIIDSDPSTEDDLTLAMWAAVEGIFVPFELSELDWQSYHQLKQDMTKRYSRHPQDQPPILGVIPNKILHTKNNPTPLTYLKAMYRDAEEIVFRPIHWSKIFGECLNQRISTLEHPAAQSDRAARELCALTLDIIGYKGDLTGLKTCEICGEQFDLAGQERATRESEGQAS